MMSSFEKIYNALIKNGFSEDIASMLAEHLSDWGWEDIRDILNTIEE